MTNRSALSCLGSLLLAFALLLEPLAGQDTGAAGAGEAESATWSFFFNLGGGGLVGDFSPVLETPLTGEFGIRRWKGNWRYGLGVNFGSFAMKPPYEDEPEYGFQRIFVSGARIFRGDRELRPFVEGRLGITRLHPRSNLFDLDPLPPGFEIGDSPTAPGNGFNIGIMPGVEWQLSRSVGLDLSVLGDYFHTGEMDLAPVGRDPASSGFDWQVRLGFWWNTDDGSDPATARRDAWGVRRSWGWGLGEALAINFAASGLNEYVRNANFNQISPRSWWSNVEDGFTYDDNEFTTNQFIHPFNGSQYYNAARTNGLGFWPSYAVAMIGAFQWELAGETHPMSFNDLVSTGIGGAAIGETMYRFSSMILDNQATGSSRFFREAGAFIVDPIRGFNRVITGRAWKVRPNPASPYDTNPPGQINAASIGWRRVGDGASLTNNVNDYAFLGYAHVHGDVFDETRRGPFDFFQFDGELYFGEKSAIGRLILQGNLLAVPVGRGEEVNQVLGVLQHFDYANNNTFEYGGQSVGATLYSRWGEVGPVGFETQADLMATILGAVNSDASELAEVPDQERIREYDYGPGGGGGLGLSLTWGGRQFLTARYRVHYLKTLNGSIYHKDDLIGLDSEHWLHGVDARLDVPVSSGIGVGARYMSFTRESHYKVTLPQDLPPGVSVQQFIKQTNPQVRVYLSWVPSWR